MGLAYKWKDTVLGGIVNKSKNNKKMSRVNNNSQGKYIYMTKEDGEKIKDFLDLDDNRSKQIMQDAQVLKKAYLSDEVVSKMFLLYMFIIVLIISTYVQQRIMN